MMAAKPYELPDELKKKIAALADEIIAHKRKVTGYLLENIKHGETPELDKVALLDENLGDLAAHMRFVITNPYDDGTRGELRYRSLVDDIKDAS